ncbi:MAG: hypothetical protein JWN40_2408 [Phycisphaerales bacterium]|nr:hypothetical protein [Phycisphaerales bacterium]
MATVPPAGDQPLLVFAQNVDTLITATPTAFGLVAGDATALHALTLDYSTRLATATTPATRNRVSVASKDTSKLALTAKLRQLIRIVSAYPPLTPSQRANLGLNPRDVTPTPVPQPATRPMLALDPDGVARIFDETTPDNRRKPPGVRGAIVFSKIGAETDAPPVSPDDARFAVIATRNRFSIPIPPGSNGKMLWVMAQWFNERGELGPVSVVASTAIAA